MRDLLPMVEGRQRAEWRRTAAICETLANCHRDPNVKPTPYVWTDFFPFANDEPPTGPQYGPADIRQAVMGW